MTGMKEAQILEAIFFFSTFNNSFKYHVLCTDGKISARINLLFYLYFPTFVLTTKGLQDRNIQLLDGTTVENKGKTIIQMML